MSVLDRINSYSASTGVGSPQKASLPRRTISSDGSKSLTTPLQLPGMRTEKGGEGGGAGSDGVSGDGDYYGGA